MNRAKGNEAGPPGEFVHHFDERRKERAILFAVVKDSLPQFRPVVREHTGKNPKVVDVREIK